MTVTLPPIDQWGVYRLGDTPATDKKTTKEGLFKITRGQYVPVSARTEGDTPRVTSTAFNNGHSGTCGMEPNGAAGTITVARNGSVGETFYQPDEYFATDDVHILTPKTPLTEGAALFVCAAIRREMGNYNYSRKLTLPLTSAIEIRLPADSNGDPDWSLMDRYIHWVHGVSIPRRKAAEKAERDRRARPLEEPISLPDVSEWGEFLVGNTAKTNGLFNIKRGGGATESDTTIPYVSASIRNNGVSDERALTITGRAGDLTITANGVVGVAFYQPRDFASSGDVLVLHPTTPLSTAAALFVCAVLNQERFRYSYSRKLTVDVLQRTRIKLPVTVSGDPDWGLMERYIRGTRHSHRLVHGEDA